jgi:hypothetical protein
MYPYYVQTTQRLLCLISHHGRQAKYTHQHLFAAQIGINASLLTVSTSHSSQQFCFNNVHAPYTHGTYVVWFHAVYRSRFSSRCLSHTLQPRYIATTELLIVLQHRRILEGCYQSSYSTTVRKQLRYEKWRSSNASVERDFPAVHCLYKVSVGAILSSARPP